MSEYLPGSDDLPERRHDPLTLDTTDQDIDAFEALLNGKEDLLVHEAEEGRTSEFRQRTGDVYTTMSGSVNGALNGHSPMLIIRPKPEVVRPKIEESRQKLQRWNELLVQAEQDRVLYSLETTRLHPSDPEGEPGILNVDGPIVKQMNEAQIFLEKYEHTADASLLAEVRGIHDDTNSLVARLMNKVHVDSGAHIDG